MTLSEKRLAWDAIGDYKEEDVKEFIKRLKEKMPCFAKSHMDIEFNLWKIIDKLAGDELVK